MQSHIAKFMNLPIYYLRSQFCVSCYCTFHPYSLDTESMFIENCSIGDERYLANTCTRVSIVCYRLRTSCGKHGYDSKASTKD